ncbi:MAG: aminopeptidase P family protein [Ruminococcaceae bacterium]|nr:aminopeptidase P family protein [Oscillospiraceae bacterium]
MTQLSRFQAALAATDADCAIISSEINIRYLCGFNYTDGYLLIFPDRAYLLTDFRYVEAVRANVKEFEIIVPDGIMLDDISTLIKKNSALRAVIEEDKISYSEFKEICKKLDGIKVCEGASKILNEQRAVKLDSELDIIAKAQSITDAAFSHILGFITPNVTEIDIALELEFFMRKMGAENTAFDTIAVSGRSSSLPHGVPQNKKLSSGFLTMDFGARVDGYCSDMTRTVVIGKADGEMKKVYSTVLSAQKSALEAIHEGIGCKAADTVARDVIKQAGYGDYFGHSLGHGVGMYIHETPSLSQKAKDTDVLKRGNVVTVEPGIYIEGKYGCRIEDMIAIDHNGKLINFTKSTKELIEI